MLDKDAGFLISWMIYCWFWFLGQIIDASPQVFLFSSTRIYGLIYRKNTQHPFYVAGGRKIRGKESEK